VNGEINEMKDLREQKGGQNKAGEDEHPRLLKRNLFLHLV
jgi:hypothetical protein